MVNAQAWFRLGAAITASSMLASAGARAQSADSTLDRAVKAYATVKTARIAFAQSIENPLTGSTTQSRGVLQQRRPGRFSVQFTEPAGDRIVSDGQFVWVYLPSTNPGQVIKAKTGDDVGTPDFAAQFLESPRKSYTVSGAPTSVIEGNATHAVVLTPRSATTSAFSKVTLWVNDTDALLRRVETVDGSGVVRRITVTSFARNAPVDAGAFVFKVPAGVKVFDAPAS